MSKRLASFGGPSMPSSSPISTQSSDKSPAKTKTGPKNKNKGRDVTPSSPIPASPKSPSTQHAPKAGFPSPSLGSRTSTYASALPKARLKASESSLQLYTRKTLKRTARDLADSDTLVSRRSLACARSLLDKTTELDNALSVLLEGAQPRSRVLGPRLMELDSKREELRGHLVDIDVVFTRLAERAAILETVLARLIHREGQESIEINLVWSETSWSFASHVSHIIKLLRQINRTRHMLRLHAETIISYSLSSSGQRSQPTNTSLGPGTRREVSIPQVTFDEARKALGSWSSESSRTTELTKEWLEICVVEVPSWDEVEVDMEESDGADEL